jgi:hypothetical protein
MILGGNLAALIGDVLASSMNMNCGGELNFLTSKSLLVGRDHVGIALESQILQWVREWFQFPLTARGVFVTGLMSTLFSLASPTNRFFHGEFYERPCCEAML